MGLLSDLIIFTDPHFGHLTLAIVVEEYGICPLPWHSLQKPNPLQISQSFSFLEKKPTVTIPLPLHLVHLPVPLQYSQSYIELSTRHYTAVIG